MLPINKIYYHRTPRITDDNEHIVNLSSRLLSNIEKKILGKGLKFEPTPRNIERNEIEENFEEQSDLNTTSVIG